MFGMKRIVIAQNERGLRLGEGTVEAILAPGVYWLFDPLGRIEIRTYDITNPIFSHPLEDVLIAEHAKLVAAHFDVVEVPEGHLGLVRERGRLVGVLAAGERKLYWKGPVMVAVELVDIRTDFELAEPLAREVLTARPGRAYQSLANFVKFATVPESHVGLLFVDGALTKSLAPGRHVYWTPDRKIEIEQVDTRVQSVEVSGQEILSKDKLSLRVNLSAEYAITDTVTARTRHADYAGTLYRALQFALRQAVGTRTLDALLADKSALDGVIFEAAKATLEGSGIALIAVGVKDLILPGEMKELLNQVVQAEKAAQANIIRRREETAATRSLLNTAKLMEENPVLMRLKELEALEKITDKIDKLTVFGGLDGVMQDMIKLNVRAE